MPGAPSSAAAQAAAAKAQAAQRAEAQERLKRRSGGFWRVGGARGRRETRGETGGDGGDGGRKAGPFFFFFFCAGAFRPLKGIWPGTIKEGFDGGFGGFPDFFVFVWGRGRGGRDSLTAGFSNLPLQETWVALWLSFSIPYGFL